MDNNYTIKTKSAPNWIYDWTKSIISVIFVVLIILTFFFRIVNVDGTSMYSTLYDGDKLFVSSFLYTPTDGDIVIISHGQYLDEPIVKRVIATEGQTLKIDFDKEKVYVDGKEQLNTWFVGFYPYDNPKYSIVVMREGGKSGAGDCCPVFRTIVEKIDNM